MSYEYLVGLVLNLSRPHSRSTLAVAQGVGLTHSRRDLPASLFDGVAGSSEEAEEIAVQVNAERSRQRARELAKRGMAGAFGL